MAWLFSRIWEDRKLEVKRELLWGYGRSFYVWLKLRHREKRGELRECSARMVSLPGKERGELKEAMSLMCREGSVYLERTAR